MIILTQTTDKIQVILSGAITTNQLQCFASYRDTTTTSITPGRNALVTNNTTAVNLVDSPASSTQRSVEYLNVYNSDTVSATVTILFNDNGTTYELYTGTILPSEKIEYHANSGFIILDQFGSSKTSITYQPIPLVDGYSTVILGSDYTNSNAVANTLEDITGYSFSVLNNKTYWFRFQYIIVPSIATTGHRVTINGPTFNDLGYNTMLIASAASVSITWNNAYGSPATSNATTPSSGGTGFIEGIIRPSADGTLQARLASEVAGSGVTIKAGSVILYKQLD